jgi:hypothetical protein
MSYGPNAQSLACAGERGQKLDVKAMGHTNWPWRSP